MTADDDRTDIRDMLTSDVAAIVEFAEEGAALTPETSLSFGTDARQRRSAHLQQAIADRATLALVATRDGRVRGYLLSVVAPAPPEPTSSEAAVAAAAGPVAYVTDFAVATAEEWWVAGASLLTTARQRVRQSGAERVLVPVDGPDPVKRAFLWRSGLTLEFERYESPLA